MTALPESEAATSLVLNALLLEQAPDGVGDGAAVDDGAVDDAVGRHRLDGERRRRLKPLPAGFSSTALTALEPMSRPTTGFVFPRPNTMLSFR